ncbi:Probable serine/threonine-protein kinase DDB_G0284251, partial [Geodia barretti]
MCSRVQQSSSASETSASTCTPDRESLLIRQKKVLTRDDSGVFSSPSPLTPSRGPLTVFSLPPSPDPSAVACSSASTAAPVSSPLDPGTIMSDSREDRQLPASLNHPRANASLGLKQAPEHDETLLQAFYCRQEIGLERWATCSHAHCTTIRDQWRHLITCGQVCQNCQNFQRRILLHAAQCSDENCFVTLCPDAKNRLAGATTRRPGPPQRSNSVQSSLGSPHPPQFLSLNSQGSLDDMSPMSPLDYPSFVRDLRQVGAGTLPRYLQGNLSLRASEIMRSMESDGPLDKFAPGENSNPSAAVSPSSQGSKYNPVGAGILSPIEEHPSSEARSKYPSQIILHPLEPEFLTQGRDGRYLHRRDYDLNEHLGTGGFGTCACARDYKTDKIFVIKSNKFSDENMVNTLKAESDILSRIPAHTNITTFLGAVLEEEQAKDGAQRHCRLMMELAEHGSLASMLQSDEGELEPLPLDQSLFYLYQILQGVFHLHSLSILHLDIKAENVLVLEGGRRVKLTDFGTAAHIDDIAGSISKLKGVTPHFTSPEIIRGDVPSFSSDIWSTVCVLIQLLTARLPGCITEIMSRESMMYTVRQSGVINPRHACAARVTVVVLCVCLSVCYHVFCHHAQQTGQKATPTGSALHWLHFKTGDFRKSTAFKKLWREKQVNKPICKLARAYLDKMCLICV